MLANWVKQSTSTTGTAATLSLDGTPPAGFIAFSDAFVDQESVCYSITDGDNREIGAGYLTAGAPWTLTREVIWDKLENGVYTRGPISVTANPTAPLALSGTAEVSIDATAQWAAVQPAYMDSTKANRRVGPEYVLKQIAGGADALPVNQVAFCPFWSRATMKAAVAQFHVGTGTGSINVICGIYSWPNDDTMRLISSTGVVAATPGGVNTAPLAPVTYLKAHVPYMFALVTDNSTYGLGSLKTNEIATALTRANIPWWRATRLYYNNTSLALPATVSAAALGRVDDSACPTFIVRDA
ncbi:hypothetical protein D6833_01220 [Candidatus Parcubacteria bacterium]|nr:MAG: hypothetical protein D6833_01220 [Candidatus Parcubacteria bacterium]